VSTTFVINIPTDVGVTDTVAHVHAAFLGATVSASATLQIDPRVTIPDRLDLVDAALGRPPRSDQRQVRAVVIAGCG